MSMLKQTLLILLWVFMTNDIVNREHEMSTAKSLCYMAPPALVSKCQPRKMVKNVRLSHPHHHSAAHVIQQILLIFVTDIINFLGSCRLWNFMNTHWPVWGTTSTTTLQPTIFKGSYWYFVQPLSWVGTWTLLIVAYLYHPLEFHNFINKHWLMFKYGFVTALQLTIFRVSCSYLSQLLPLVRARILLITVSFMKISSWNYAFSIAQEWPYNSKFAF